jgi:hypothetical protein
MTTNANEPKLEDLEDLEDFEDIIEPEANQNGQGEATTRVVGANCSNFNDFLLKRELNLAIKDCGFEHPSEVQ